MIVEPVSSLFDCPQQGLVFWEERLHAWSICRTVYSLLLSSLLLSSFPSPSLNYCRVMEMFIAAQSDPTTCAAESCLFNKLPQLVFSDLEEFKEDGVISVTRCMFYLIQTLNSGGWYFSVISWKQLQFFRFVCGELPCQSSLWWKEHYRFNFSGICCYNL